MITVLGDLLNADSDPGVPELAEGSDLILISAGKSGT